MKKTLLVVLLLVFALLRLSAQWQTQTPVGTPNVQGSSNLAAFPTGQTGYVAGSSSSHQSWEISKTTNGGNTWSPVVKPDSALSINYMKFLTDQTGFIAGFVTPDYHPTLYQTTDGGTSWIDITPDSAQTRHSSGYEVVHFVDANNGYFAMENTVFKTTDGGTSWTFTHLDVGFYPPLPFDIDFADADHGTVACWDGTFFYAQLFYTTTDGGATWSRDSLGTLTGWQIHTQRPTQDLIYLYGGGGSWQSGPRIYKSVNGGATWDSIVVQILVDSMAAGTEMQFTDSDSGYMVTDRGHVLRTVDGGQSWALEYQASEPLYDIRIAPTAIFAVGENGLCIKKDLATGIWEPQGPSPELRFYPNPVSDLLTIDGFQDREAVTVWVQDVSGRTIEKQSFGRAEAIRIKANDWPRGVYIVTLESSDWIVSKKVNK